MKRLLTQRSRACCARLLIGVLFSLMLDQPVLAHAGVDHSNSCFLNIGETRLRISGYSFQPELEGKASAPAHAPYLRPVGKASAPAHAPYLRPVGKHFCHFFPELGQIVLAVEPMAAGQEKTLVSLELAALTSWLNPAQAFTVIKRQPEQSMNSGPSISQTIRQRGIYRLNVTLQDGSGNSQQQHFVFLVGIPVTKIMVMIAGLLVLVIGFAGIRGVKKKS
ncbi:MAG: hypothetical protein PSV18_00960 [Methylobacter sp.]|nr:hypothetical protein [Candidatus Methylobacter titanis]